MTNIIDITNKLKANKPEDMIKDYSTYLLSYLNDDGVTENTVVSVSKNKTETLGDAIKLFEKLYPKHKIQGLICCDEVLNPSPLNTEPKNE